MRNLVPLHDLCEETRFGASSLIGGGYLQHRGGVMTDDERLRTGLASIGRAIELTHHLGEVEEHPLSADLEALVIQIERESSMVRVRHVNGACAPSPLDGPALSLGGESGAGRIHYHAVPIGPELPPFLELLGSLTGGRDSSTPPSWSKGLDAMDSPAEISVFISSDCPHCPQGVRSSIALCLASDLVSLSIIDVSRHLEATEALGIQSVPTTVIDGELSIVGVVAPSKLARRLQERGSGAYDRHLFRSHVDGGRFEKAAEVFIDRQAAHSLFVEWWRQSTLTERIQLMLVVEATLEMSASAFDFLLPQLTEGLVELADASLRGDTVDMLGRIGNPSSKPIIEALCHDPHPDVAEIAQEVLEEIEEGGRHAD